MSANSVSTEELVAGSINAEKIAGDAIIARTIAAGAIESEHVSAKAVDASWAVVGNLSADHISADVINAHTIWRADTLSPIGESNPPRRNGGGPILVDYSHGGNMDTMPSDPQLPLTGVDLTRFTWLMFFCWDVVSVNFGLTFPMWMRADTVNARGSTPISNNVIGACANRACAGRAGRDLYAEILASYTTRGFHFAQQTGPIRISHIYGILNPGHMLSPTNVNNDNLGGSLTWNGWVFTGTSEDYKSPRFPSSLDSGVYLRALYLSTSGRILLRVSSTPAGSSFPDVLTNSVRARFYMTLRSGQNTLSINRVGNVYSSGSRGYIWTPKNSADVTRFSNAISGSNRSCFLEMGST